MDWTAQNELDAKLLPLVDLASIEIELGEDENEFTQQIAQHNAALIELKHRFAKLAEDRAAMADERRWLKHDSDAVIAERRRLVAESWDVLVALRRTLAEREGLLRRLEAHVADRSTGLEEQRHEALAKAHKALVREHRAYLKAQPVHGPDYIEALAAQDEAVVELNPRIDELDAQFARLQSIRHRVSARQAAVAVRQREVFHHLTT